MGLWEIGLKDKNCEFLCNLVVSQGENTSNPPVFIITIDLSTPVKAIDTIKRGISLVKLAAKKLTNLSDRQNERKFSWKKSMITSENYVNVWSITFSFGAY